MAYEDYYNENKQLMYSYTRTMFGLMKARPEERISLGEASRTFGPFIEDLELVMYPTIFVQNYMTSKGVYTGTMRYGVMHGFGEYEITKSFGLYNEVKTYKGYLAHEKMHLQGEINYRNRSECAWGTVWNSEKYVGKISWEIPWGKGAMTTVNGVIREGNFEGSSMLDDANSTIKYTDGSSIKGPTVKGVPNGKCTQTLVDGTILEGEFKMGKKHGEFTIKQYHPEETNFLVKSFKGRFVEDKKHGQVSEFEYNQYEYEGNYEMGVKSGYGKWKVSDKFEYEGELQDGEFHGNGSLTSFKYGETETYMGGFEKGEYHGLGELRLGDGTEYRGTWDHGKKSGEFNVVSPDGVSQFALFVDGYEIKDEDY